MDKLLKNVQSILTAVCGIAMLLCFVPGLSWLAYVSVVAGSYFALGSAFASLKERTFDVNFLMVFAAIGAIVVRRVEDAAILLFLFSLSSTMEALAMAKTKSAIEGLVKLRPTQAIRVVGSNEERVAVEALSVGDLVRIPPFETVPVDGEVVDGASAVNQSAMTGESEPVAKKKGDNVLLGTQNMEGMLTVRVASPVGDSTLDRIVALVEDAQENKASGERISQWFGERYTVFVLGVFVVALVVRLYVAQQGWNEALYGALILLVALSPCALVISTPATTLSALAWAARNGILVRGGEYIERAGNIDVVALDKTGTLTYGRPTLREICVCETEVHPSHDGVACGPDAGCWLLGGPLHDGAKRLMRFAASVEQYAAHPVAQAVIRAARENEVDIPEATEHTTVPGLGVKGTVPDGAIVLGREQLLRDEGMHLPDTFVEHARELEYNGMTVALLASPDGLAALGFNDGIREESAEFIQTLKQNGVKKVVMLTGDMERTAEHVASELGLDAYHANLLPHEKTAVVEKMSKEGHVMMVGDGINDAPSLALAHVGVAMGGLGSDVALNAADVVLMHDRLDRIPELIRLGKRTQGIIRANLLFAASVITLLTLSSLFLRLPLPLAVIGHEGSTVLVILNGLRLLGGPGK